jgi:hypothetical protein
VGIPIEFFFEIIDSKVMKIFDKFVSKFHGCGISTDRVHVQQTDKMIDSWWAKDLENQLPYIRNNLKPDVKIMEIML